MTELLVTLGCIGVLIWFDRKIYRPLMARISEKEEAR
jgi:hypothetical protein